MMPASLALSELAAHAPDILAATAAAVEDAEVEADGVPPWPTPSAARERSPSTMRSWRRRLAPP